MASCPLLGAKPAALKSWKKPPIARTAIVPPTKRESATKHYTSASNFLGVNDLAENGRLTASAFAEEAAGRGATQRPPLGASAGGRPPPNRAGLRDPRHSLRAPIRGCL